MTERERELILTVAEATAGTGGEFALGGPKDRMPALVRLGTGDPLPGQHSVSPPPRDLELFHGATLEEALEKAAVRLGLEP